MINWWHLIIDSLWIIGFAMLLASISWSFYTASVNQQHLRTQLRAPGVTFVVSTGMMLAMFGLALRRDHLWMSIIWIILAVGFAYIAWQALRDYLKTTHSR